VLRLVARVTIITIEIPIAMAILKGSLPISNGTIRRVGTMP
jgi:hypothetical protein